MLLLILSKTPWYSHADFRGFEDTYALSAVVLLSSNRLVVAVLWVVAFAHRGLQYRSRPSCVARVPGSAKTCRFAPKDQCAPPSPG